MRDITGTVSAKSRNLGRLGGEKMRKRCVGATVNIVTLLTFASIALEPIMAHATTIVGPYTPDGLSFNYSAGAGDEQTNDIGGGGAAGQLPVQKKVAPPSEYHFGGDASVSITSFPSITVKAAISGNCSDGACIGHASASASLAYYFYVKPLANGIPFSSVPIGIFGSVSISSSAPGNSGSVVVETSDQALVAYNHTFLGSTPYSEKLSLISSSNTEYEVVMSANASQGSNDGPASTFIDPMISIDPSFVDASDYQLVFSPEIQNDVSNTPLPPGLPLFATGVGVLGLLCWRRKRQNAAAIAA